jgi:hypothetical protein
MHPEVVMDKAGKCPKCGMALVPKKDAKKEMMKGKMENMKDSAKDERFIRRKKLHSENFQDAAFLCYGYALFVVTSLYLPILLFCPAPLLILHGLYHSGVSGG